MVTILQSGNTDLDVFQVRSLLQDRDSTLENDIHLVTKVALLKDGMLSGIRNIGGHFKDQASLLITILEKELHLPKHQV